MFERFTKDTVRAVHAAVGQAHQTESGNVAEEHLVYGLFREPGTLADQLTDGAVTLPLLRESFARAHRLGGVSQTEAQTLREFGIDVTEVVSAVEKQLGAEALSDSGTGGGAAAPKKRRHTPFTRDAKDVLAGAVREASQRRDKHIGDDHLLLAVLRRGGLSAGVLAEHGATYEKVSARVE